MPSDNRFKLLNSLSRRLEPFKPKEDGRVKIFTCGPSVYRPPHLGNYRTFLFEDLVVRYLEHLGYEVKRAINFTNIEDKAISEAKKMGRQVWEQTTPVEEQFLREIKLLGLKMPDAIPKSSTSVGEAVEIITKLMQDGYAYEHEGDIFFDPLKFPGFGALYGLDMSTWPKTKVRFRKDTYPGERWNRGDFILWHGSGEDDEVCWDTPLGKGRPSWNIQDPAMIRQTLGDWTDICCGGIDNLVRHHDYNKAVMESFTGTPLANYWLHGGHLYIDGHKMSKSRGNIVYLEDMTAKGHSPRQVRFFLLYGHYRDRQNLTDKLFAERMALLERMDQLVSLVTREGGKGTESPLEQDILEAMEHGFHSHMNDDLKFKQAFDAVVAELEKLRDQDGRGGLSAAARSRAGEMLKSFNRVWGVLSI